MTLAELDELLKLLAGTSVLELTLHQRGAMTRIRRTPFAPIGERRKATIAPSAGPPKVRTAVRAGSIGKSRNRHPLQEDPIVKIGDAVHAGQIVAWIQMGKILVAVRAQRAGKVVEIAPEGLTIGFDFPMVFLESPPDGPEQ